MGNSTSSSTPSSARSSASAPAPAASKIVRPLTDRPMFRVTPSKQVLGSEEGILEDVDLDLSFFLRIEAESLTLLKGKEVIFSFPFVNILCWGFNSYSFHWRVVEKDTEPVAPSHQLHLFVAEEGTTVAAAVAELQGLRIGEPSAAALDGSLHKPKLVSFAVCCEEGYGAVIEAEVMAAVTLLMGRMSGKGVPEDEFQVLMASLASMGEAAGEGLEEGGAAGSDGFSSNSRIISLVKQVSLTRSFDCSQASQLISKLTEVSPFDVVEAAVLLYDSILNPEAFPLVLMGLPHPGDRDNVCHRLGIRINASGEVEELQAGNSARARRKAAAAAAAAAAVAASAAAEKRKLAEAPKRTGSAAAGGAGEGGEGT